MGYTSQAKGFFQKAISVGLNNIDEMLKYRASNSANLIKLQHMDEYCRKNHLDPTAVVSGYITSNPLSGIALISTSNPDHLSEIMRCADYNLPISEIEWYDRIDLIQNDKYWLWALSYDDAGTGRHGGGVTIRETAHHASATVEFLVRPFDNIADLGASPVPIRKS